MIEIWLVAVYGGLKPQSISESLNIINDLNSVWNVSYKIVVFFLMILPLCNENNVQFCSIAVVPLLILPWYGGCITCKYLKSYLYILEKKIVQYVMILSDILLKFSVCKVKGGGLGLGF